MITDWVISMIVATMAGMASLLPEFDTGWIDGLVEALDGLDLWANLFQWDQWIPLDLIVASIGGLIALRLFLGGYAFLRHLWDALPLT